MVVKAWLICVILAWGEVARKEGLNNIGTLFEAIAYAEYVHANNHFNVLKEQKGDFTVPSGAVFGNTTTVENLQGAIDGELHEVEQMYPVYLNTAEYQDEKGAKRSFHYALEAEKIHVKMFKEAQEAAKAGKDYALEAVYICPVCGYTVLDEAPGLCPICGAKKEVFKEFK